MNTRFSKADLEAVKSLFSSPKKIVITTHYKPDGDALGASLGLQLALKSLGNEVNTISPSEFPAFLNWMHEADTVIDYLKDKNRAESMLMNADLLICLDFNDPGRVEGMSNLLLASPAQKVLIDHHLDPKDFCNYTFSDTSASSTCELIVSILRDMDFAQHIHQSAAEAFYCGIMTDTGSFRFSSVTPKTHETVALLLSKGARNYYVHEQIYDTSSEWRLRFLGHSLLKRMTVLPEYKTVYFSALKEEMEAYHHQPGDTEGLVNYGLSITGMKMAVLFSERDQMIKISFRSKGEFSVKELAEKYFEGGGHKNAAGGRSLLSIDDTINKFVDLLPEYTKELS